MNQKVITMAKTRKIIENKDEKSTAAIKAELVANPEVNESEGVKELKGKETGDMDDDETKQAKERRVTFKIIP